MSGVATAVAVVGTIGSAIAANKQADAQKDSIRAQKRIADVNTARERVQAARQMRIQRAQVLASAGNEGIGGSGVSGAVSSIGSQFGGNIANINTMQTLGAQASAANQRAVDAGAQAANWQAIGGVAKSFIKPNMPSNWNNIFSTGNK